jgi:hypothetical protein
MFPASYGAVWLGNTDRPPPLSDNPVVAGAVVDRPAGEPRFLHQDDPRLIVLAHPLERSILRSTGYTLTTCALAGRYVQIHQVICRNCGTLFDVRRLTAPPLLGCPVGLAAGLAAGVLVGIQDESFCLGVTTGYLTAIGVMLLLHFPAALFVRWRYRERARAIEGLGECPQCGSRDRAVVPTCKERLPCPACKQRTQAIRTVGMS